MDHGAISIKQAVEEDLFGRQGVVGVCTGTKIKGGADTGQPAVVVFVAKKLADVPAADRIPATIDEMLTDVIEYDPTPLTMSLSGPVEARRRPITPGMGVGYLDGNKARLERATLGMFYAYDGRVYSLTAAHLVGGEYPALPGIFCQPYNGGIQDQVSAHREGAWVSYAQDALAIPLDHGEDREGAGGGLGLSRMLHYAAIFDQQLGRPRVHAAPIHSTTLEGGVTLTAGGLKAACYTIAKVPAVKGENVDKLGANTGLTTGYVFATDCSVTMNYPWGRQVMKDVIVVYSHRPQPFARPGDSGSTVGRQGSGNALGTLVNASGRMAMAVPVVRQLKAMHGDGAL